jgi:hypothetical protein
LKKSSPSTSFIKNEKKTHINNEHNNIIILMLEFCIFVPNAIGKLRDIVLSIYREKWVNPSQIATECFLTVFEA